MGWVCRGVVVLVLVFGGLSITVGGASAAGWLTPVSASPSGTYLSTLDLGVDAQGNSVAVWGRKLNDRDWGVVAATRPVGGQWSAPVDISPSDERESTPRVAVNARGDAVAVWNSWRWDEVMMVVRAASRPAGGEWSAPVIISADGGTASGAQVAIDEEGNATAAWSQVIAYAGDDVARTASLPFGGEWSQPVNLSDPAFAVGRSPQVALGRDGGATAVWTVYKSSDGPAIVQSKSRPAGGTWSDEAIDLSSDGGNASQVQVAVDPQDTTTVAWSYDEGADHDDFAVQAVQRVAGSEWGTPVDLSEDRADTVFPEVALAGDAQGNTTAVWGSYEPGGYVVRTSSRATGGTWSGPVDLTAPDGSVYPWAGPNIQLVVDPQGDVTATWRVAAGSSDIFRMQSAHRSIGGAWSAPVDLSAAGDLWTTETAVDAQGYVTTIWKEQNRIRSRVFDPIAPLLGDLTVPVTGVVGQPVAMSVGPFDVWSPVTTSWDFGDGRSGSGATVNHCYSSPGERTVTITGTDLAANATTTSRTISIAPNPALAPGADPCAGPPEPPGPPDPPGPPGPPGPPDPGHPGPPATDPDSRPAKPVVSGLRQSNPRWRTQGSRRGSRAPVGTTFRFKLDRSARVRFAFSQIVAGRRVGARCVKATSANREQPRCDRYRPRGTLEIAGKAGANTYSFQGKLRGVTLTPGRYRLLVTALADGRMSGAVSVGFTIAR
jgi:PKD domain-containing protein